MCLNHFVFSFNTNLCCPITWYPSTFELSSILNPPGGHKRQTKLFLSVIFCLSFITQSSLILLFRARDMPPRPFPKFLEIWLYELLPRDRNATTACVQREASVSTRTHTPHGSSECPVIRLCFDLDTHREESTNGCVHTGGCSLCPGMYTKSIQFCYVPSDPPTDPCTHFTHSSHTTVSGCHKSAGRDQWFLGAVGHWPSPTGAALLFPMT